MLWVMCRCGWGLGKILYLLSYVHFNLFARCTFGIGVYELQGHDCIWQLMSFALRWLCVMAGCCSVLCASVNILLLLLYLKKVLEVFSISSDTCSWCCKQCKVLKNQVFLGCDTLLLTEWLPEFWRIVVPSSCKVKAQEESCDVRSHCHIRNGCEAYFIVVSSWCFSSCGPVGDFELVCDKIVNFTQ